MKLLFKSLLIFAVVLIVGCSKETPPAPPQPVAKPESPVLKNEIKALHNAEDASQATTDAITEQRNQIDAATQ